MSKSPYVSPNLGPTTPWANQTSTGLFRPPEQFALHSSSHEPSGGEDSLPPKNSPSFTVSAVDSKPESSALKDAESWKTKPSPMLHATAPPFYPSNANSPEHGFLPPPPPFRQHGGGNGSGLALPPPGTHSLDDIMRAISYTVHREEDQYAALKESNRALEDEIQHLQVERHMRVQEMDQLDMYAALLTELHRQQVEFLERKTHGTTAATMS